MTPEQHRRAAIAYSAYAMRRGYKAHDGSAIPKYEKVDPDIQEAWYDSYLASAQTAFYEASGRIVNESRAMSDRRSKCT